MDNKNKRFFKKNWPLILAAIYVLSPIDIIPEAILPVIGMADDAVVLLIELVRRYRMEG